MAFRRSATRPLAALPLLIAGGLAALAIVAAVREQRDVDLPASTGLGALVGDIDPAPRAATEEPFPDPGDYRAIGFDASRVESAKRWAGVRAGDVSFAVVDQGGVMWGSKVHDRFHSASVVKAMLLAAELRRLDDRGLPLDDQTRAVLAAMITVSDNDAATAIYERVGNSGLNEVAATTGMHDFEVATSWGDARISAADMALLFADLDGILPQRFAGFGKDLLGSVVREQSWGVPAVAKGWKTRFKGGWRETRSGQLVSQAAELRRGDRSLAMAVLTDGQPSMGYGIVTVEGVASRLLGR